MSVSKGCNSILLAKRGIERPSSIFQDLAVRFDRIAARRNAIFVCDLDIAYVHDLLRMIELSFQVSYKKASRSPYRRSNPNPLVGLPSPILSVHRLNLGNKILYYNSHFNNFVRVLILCNLDVCGLVPLGVLDLVVDLLDDPGRLHFDSVGDVCVQGVLTTFLRRSPVSGTGSATM